MSVFCAFCFVTEEEDGLIELTTNLLLIGDKHYEFSHVFSELFNIISEDLKSNCICETCKDRVIDFFVFKSNITCQMNRKTGHRNMIMTQVESFLNGTRIEDVQVVRKIHSITLQVDESVAETFREEKIAKLEPCLNDQIDQDDIETYEVNPIIAESEPDEGIIEEIEDEEFTRCYQCDKCDEVTSTEESLEVHSFMKHSLLGITIETDVENNQELVVGSDGVSTLMRKCPTCCLFFETPTSLTIHLLECHSDEMLMSVVDTTSINFDNITKYIAYIRELMLLNETKFESVFKIEEDFKEYFYQYYSSDMVAGEEQVEDVKPQIKQERIHVIIESKFPKAEKVSVELNDEMRTWLRKEMTLRKRTVKSDCGEKRTIYQCAYCNVYSSNSQPGFRYHLMAKHLKGNNIADLQEVPAEFIPPVTVDKKARNVCRECNIKMKDQKHFESHQNAHELLAVISQHYMLPSCNTCNTVFIDDPALKLHLSKHDTNEDVSEPVIVHPGAMTLQSRKLKTPGETQSDEITDNNFAWNCGHCSMRFNKEVSCRYHLLIHHVSTFACPIDKREFSGFKVISLFCHHLKNKHSEMFPELIFSCTFCKTEFPSVYEKLAHMKNCTLKKFSCDHCGKKFFKKADLEAHLRFISGELFFPCKICDKRCETASDLNIHFRSHTKEKPFPCSICQKRFRTLATRSAHLESHNENKVFTCVCGKSFKQRQLYRRHCKAAHEQDTKIERLPRKRR